MAQYNKGFGVSFNDNDGGAVAFVSDSTEEDMIRHYKCLGTWRGRWFFLKIMWRAIRRAEEMYGIKETIWFPKPEHKFKV